MLSGAGILPLELNTIYTRGGISGEGTVPQGK